MTDSRFPSCSRPIFAANGAAIDVAESELSKVEADILRLTKLRVSGDSGSDEPLTRVAFRILKLVQSFSA